MESNSLTKRSNTNRYFTICVTLPNHNIFSKKINKTDTPARNTTFSVYRSKCRRWSRISTELWGQKKKVIFIH